jgi:chitodextrinase
VDGDVSDTYMSSANVQRIKSIFDEEDWNRGFPLADPIYTFDNFLKAAAKFPHFCNETNIAGHDLEKACTRELAAVFAHWTQETGKRSLADGEFWTQGLYHVEEMRCKDTYNGTCDYKSTNWSAKDNAWPPQHGV